MQELHSSEETETSLLEGSHKVLCELGSSTKTDFIGIWARPICWSLRVYWGNGMGEAVTGVIKAGGRNIMEC